MACHASGLKKTPKPDAALLARIDAAVKKREARAKKAANG
jgi:hypothetical protein